MINAFTLASLPKIHFGWGCRNHVAETLLTENYRKVVLISARFLARSDGFCTKLKTTLEKSGVEVSLFKVSGEPSPETVDRIVSACPEDIESVIGVGGGSVLDTAKAVAGLLPSRHPVMHYLEGVGEGRPFDVATLPFYALPTTAGTGSETTKNAVLSRIGQFKKSFRDEKLLAKAVWLDPEFLTECPKPLLFNTGMDAFTQLVESYTTLKSNPITDALAWQGMTLFKGAFERIESDDENLRKTGYGDLMMAASLSGITLANAGLGAVHGLAGPIGAFFEAPHGAVCAALLAPITSANISSLQSLNTPQAKSVLKKYADIGRLFVNDQASDEEALVHLTTTLSRLSQTYVPQTLSDFGITPCQLDPIIHSCRSGSMLGNPVELTDKALLEAIYQAL